MWCNAKTPEGPQILGFLDCFAMLAMTVRKVIPQKSGGDQLTTT
ncbi:hypothetical protein [Candidatus Sarmatiella mevalonica]|nr:hypothetical protein [Candidatus Sarmatiella mevalonica]